MLVVDVGTEYRWSSRAPRVVLDLETSKVLSEQTATNDGIVG